MQIDMNNILEAYREEISRLTNEVIILKAQVKQLQNDLSKDEQIE